MGLVAPVCNPTLQVIGLQIPCMEKAGAALDALQLYLRLKYQFIHTLPQSKYIFSNTRDNFYFVSVWFNNMNNVQEFEQTLISSIEGDHLVLVVLVDKDSKAKSRQCTSLLLMI